jgi:hypothetical protein
MHVPHCNAPFREDLVTAVKVLFPFSLPSLLSSSSLIAKQRISSPQVSPNPSLVHHESSQKLPDSQTLETQGEGQTSVNGFMDELVEEKAGEGECEAQGKEEGEKREDKEGEVGEKQDQEGGEVSPTEEQGNGSKKHKGSETGEETGEVQTETEGQ